MDDYERVAQLLHTRNAVDQEISHIIQRPMSAGHLGEWLASRIFGIDLHASATHTGSDGVFADGPQVGRTVNIKWYGKRENLLDISTVGPPDTYLVMTGPHSAAASSRGALRPLCVENVYLFVHEEVVAALTARGTKIGIASSVVKAQWAAAEIFPAASPRLPLSDVQRSALALLRTPDAPVRTPPRRFASACTLSAEHDLAGSSQDVLRINPGDDRTTGWSPAPG